MITITTAHGKQIAILSQAELHDPRDLGERVRAYCHIHGSDHQRSLSIDKTTGWGYCFNAVCHAKVLVADWNPRLAQRLIDTRASFSPSLLPVQQRLPFRLQSELPVLFGTPPQWQRDELSVLLTLDEWMRRALEHAARAQRYLEERGLPLDIAMKTGVGYLPPTVLNIPALRKYRSLLRRWTERIMFPLVSPMGRGYIGRSLWHWHPGIDEAMHKILLDQPGRPRRWIKTNPAGWFGVEAEKLQGRIILVEGAFDRLTLLAAGWEEEEVIALAGTALHHEWLPYKVQTAILALDSDEGGREATRRLAEELEQVGLEVRRCEPPLVEWGKDWNESWRHGGLQSIVPLCEACELAS